ncbi:PaaI family thioesterase [Nocardia zapadnayensis]|uniref:PaaI family thioesterase n=1 Tax=Nocardia rhamnosiphila TaxID=426716 RepID=UPI002247D9F8|nr:PaaI family thioesterase [Nocardia zapadnayensis]MCX0272815.1 PaaI family thioesterase [Nocardia zapadnayensis]
MTAKTTKAEAAVRVPPGGRSTAAARPGVDADPGPPTFRVPLAPATGAAVSRVDPLTLAIIADAAVGTAVISGRPGRAAGVMAELCIDHVGTPGDEATALDIVAETLESGPDTGTGRATVRDDTGVVVAHVVGVVALDPAGGRVPERAHPRSFDPPDIRLVPLDSDSVRVEIRPDMLNDRGTVHGGVLLGLAQRAQELFQLYRRVGCRPLRMSIDYLRPAPPDRHLVLRSSFERRGRRLWIVRTEILDRGGRTVAIAHGTGAVADPAAKDSLESRG